MRDKPDYPDARTHRFVEIEREATLLAEAYRLRLVGRLWWANLAFVVLPSVCAAAAAIFAAGGAGMNADVAKALAAGLAGLAAVLSAVHKSLKCEEYQNECLRLGAAYDAIAARAASAELSPTPDDSKSDELKDLTEKMATLKESARAPLPDKYIAKARSSIAERKHATNADVSQAHKGSA
ncbi:MAG: hypothetical protein AABN33_22720 [Acidobacteriota bacterium]